MIELKTVLIPTDFSDTSKEAFKYAAGMAQEFKAELLVLHVINEQLLTEGLNFPRLISMQDLEKEMNRQAERSLDEFLKQGAAAAAGVAIKKRLIMGNPAAEIIRVAQKENCDLIVIGTHGRSGIEHILFGSTAEKVVRKAPCPVLTVKPAQREFVIP